MAKKIKDTGILWKFKVVNTDSDPKVVFQSDTLQIKKCCHGRMVQFGEDKQDHQCIFCKEIFSLNVDPESGDDKYFQVIKN